MSKTSTRLLSEGEAEKLKAWQKQFHADATPPSHETKRERINRLKRLAWRRRMDTGIKLQRPRKAPATKELIMANVSIDNTSGCWVWRSGKGKNGYGKVRHLGKDEHAHRVSWKLWVGQIPEGIQCLHHCDNPPCCNPTHLFLGTDDDNSKDKARKERTITKLTFEQVEAIRRDKRAPKEIATEYGITPDYIYQLRNGDKRTLVPYRLMPCA